MTMDCVFCKIVEGKIPSVKVEGKPSWIAIRDINPQAPQHILGGWADGQWPWIVGEKT